MKKIVFDLTKTQPVGDIKYHGGGRYGEIVFEALANKFFEVVVGFYDSRKWINPKILDICRKRNIELIDSSRFSLNDVANEFGGVVYSPLLERRVTSLDENIIYICTIHGLRTLEMPYDSYSGFYEERRLVNILKPIFKFKAILKRRKELLKYRETFNLKNLKLITVSHHSKSSILSFIPFLNSKDIPVFYSPSTVSQEKDSHQEVVEARDKYYLIVSGNRWIKNSLRAMIAIDQIFEERPSIEGKVIVTGVGNVDVFKRHIKHLERFEFLEYVSESELEHLYKYAFLFIYPSLNEGFGYPPLEAMSFGTPIIASAIASIPEICGDAVSYFNPYSIDEIKMRILQMEDSNYRDTFLDLMQKRFDFVSQRQRDDLSRLTDFIYSVFEKSKN
ncbi:glycosyltransferase [Marinilongibacter aquaticus]|uniref:glycosyltransferase n=1 Tax=Marinilongibacter aquaticus TaxID=2975157 RepID=UPI0021BD3162|nr:glycosyltransferase [Marinilongibacter aquaticus]UBM58076.1 glycosyltransferase [Marinilongibacter aquaticus]